MSTIDVFITHWINGKLIFNALQQMALIFVIAFFFSQSSVFRILVKNILHRRDWFLLYVIFSIISVMGSVLATNVSIPGNNGVWTQVDSRSIGAFLAGLLGGPLLGTAVGFTAGCYRLSLGGSTAIAGFVGTTLAGLIAGLVYQFCLKNNPEKRFSWQIAVITVCVVELIMKGLVFLTLHPFSDALALIQITLLPNIIGNSVGAALFVSVLSEYERNNSASSNRALRMAGRMTKALQYGLNSRSADIICRIIRKETQISAVAMSSRDQLLAFNGIGAEHHQTHDKKLMALIKQVIQQKRLLYLDGQHNKFICSSKDNCPLNSLLLTPLVVDNVVQGVLLLFETQPHFFPKVDKSLGVDLARFVSQQLLATKHQQLLHESNYEALKAQVKPHFLANALNTIAAIMRRDQQQARDLLSNLAAFMRRTIDKQQLITLSNELLNLQNYLAIETARFGDKLKFFVNMDTAVADVVIPNFIVQPLVENAIKHGTSKVLLNSKININAYLFDVETVCIEVSDDAGLYEASEAMSHLKKKPAGIGLDNVSKRIKHLCDENDSAQKYGLFIHCIAGTQTTVTVKIPYQVKQYD